MDELQVIRNRVTELMDRAKTPGLTKKEQSRILQEANILWRRLASVDRPAERENVAA